MNTQEINDNLEKYSSAITLSDMEIFVFPELLYALVLANIMSPRVWVWRDDPWFEKIDKMSPSKKVNRLKQYIIDHYEFNLDLDTWGLTDQQTELKRFAPFMNRETISGSNALFGYEGDKHYFDLDIRRHFGLEKYNDTIIPYWKTETVEAMDAFCRKENYRLGAGECVSLSTLYAAALFIICKIPLEDIFLMATPLHSQNFIAYNGGFLTNNRRIVTKNMWFNGTELTDKAQRALRNEQITMVMNNTGIVHSVYDEMSMNADEYERFKQQVGDYLTSPITFEILANFLRQHSRYQTCFQICRDCHGKKQWIPAERAYAYEHAGPYKVSDNTRDKLLADIDCDEFYCEPMSDRICLNRLEEFFHNNPIEHYDSQSMMELGKKLECTSEHKNEMLCALAGFVHLDPEFPDSGNKISKPWKKLELTPQMDREEMIAYVESMRSENPSADLSFYALRDMSRCEWTPFLKAATERNPVCIEETKEISDEELFQILEKMETQSIYDESRIAQPDEVWNFQTGDGLEKAILLSNVWKNRHPDEDVQLEIQPDRVKFSSADRTIMFESSKGLTKNITL
ncbi:hypothetical protein [Tichowtungia aerotolerans]|uniref:Uncharacterized protein n=1 Tax=Tichowtungia aerotolerans TaxID=2697043 RepID=A0A6P1M7M6_9BACT|nr:hypothetical protein [Tichowtungia aerotolerans]QHI70590.1 hypothetical protein GT409_14455 [Tichowtungia aerotolerans]